MEAEERQTHPSWGVMQITRTVGGGQNLFGATIDHQASVRIRINRASVVRDLNSNRIRDEEQLIDIEMSPVQFAEAITTIGSMGTPVTIRRLNRSKVEQCPPSNERAKIESEFAAKLSGVVEELKAHHELLAKRLSQKTLTKNEKQELLTAAQRAITEVASNVPFMHEVFHEQMDKTVAEAKAAIDAFYQHSIVEAGLASLANMGHSRPSIPCLEMQPESVPSCELRK
jgi:hypothetical protein